MVGPPTVAKVPKWEEMDNSSVGGFEAFAVEGEDHADSDIKVLGTELVWWLHSREQVALLLMLWIHSRGQVGGDVHNR